MPRCPGGPLSGALASLPAFPEARPSQPVSPALLWPQVITLEGWVEIMYYVMDAHSFYNFIYFILLIIVSVKGAGALQQAPGPTGQGTRESLGVPRETFQAHRAEWERAGGAAFKCIRATGD